LVLGHPHRYRRQVEHLPPLDTHLRRVRQIRTAAHTRTRLMPQPLVRIGDQCQRRSWMAWLPTRLASTLAAQRLRRRLGERRVRRRRLGRVATVPPHLPPQLGNLSPQRGHYRPKIGNHLPQLGVLRSQLLIGRTRVSRHHNMINEPGAKINKPRQRPDQPPVMEP
jgi:hypothetical protein